MVAAKHNCRYCGAAAPLRMRNEEMLRWMEFHLPCWSPGHRKCTDQCELDASIYLRGRQFEIAEGVDDAVRAYARALDRLQQRTLPCGCTADFSTAVPCARHAEGED